jgi:hypothetical protein
LVELPKIGLGSSRILFFYLDLANVFVDYGWTLFLLIRWIQLC